MSSSEVKTELSEDPKLSSPVVPPPSGAVVAEATAAVATPLKPDTLTAGADRLADGMNSDPSWFTPMRLLVIFCVIHLLNYIDRGVIASNGVNGRPRTCTESGICTSGSGIQGDFKLNNFEDGVLSSAFMVGLLVASPIFAALAKSLNPFRLIGVGLAVWTIATAGCGFAFNFWSIAICRMLVGVGEASFISLAAPFIDDNAPVAQKSAWLGFYYMCIPSGIALGYVYGGVVLVYAFLWEHFQWRTSPGKNGGESHPNHTPVSGRMYLTHRRKDGQERMVGNKLHWRYAFWGESILMLPFVILGFILKPLKLKGFASSESKKIKGLQEIVVPEDSQTLDEQIPKHQMPTIRGNSTDDMSYGSSFAHRVLAQIARFLKDMKELLLDRVFVTNVLGYIAYNFVIGAYSYWGPKAGYAIYHMSNADLLFGGITIVCGIFGTLAGGYVLDLIQATISNAFKLLSVATFFGAIFCLGAFSFKNLYGFIALFSVGELLLFATQAPVNFVSLHCVQPSLRALSMAMSTVSIHVFGDVPSSPLVGVLEDYLNNWRRTALILTSVYFIAALIWGIGIFLHSVDRYNEDCEHAVPATERSNLRPLLDENAEAPEGST